MNVDSKEKQNEQNSILQPQQKNYFMTNAKTQRTGTNIYGTFKSFLAQKAPNEHLYLFFAEQAEVQLVFKYKP